MTGEEALAALDAAIVEQERERWEHVCRVRDEAAQMAREALARWARLRGGAREMMDEILDVLSECAEFLDRYADYESDGYGGMEPNSAARLLYDVQQMINKAEGSL